MNCLEINEQPFTICEFESLSTKSTISIILYFN